MTRSKLTFIPVKGKRGIYADLSLRSEKLNLSGALALFAPTYEGLELLKQDLVENMRYTIDGIKKDFPIKPNEDENLTWVRTEVQRMMIEEKTEGQRRALKRIVQHQQHLLQPAKKQGGVTEAEIEQAKEFPLEDLIDKRMFKATGKWRANCHCPLVGHESEKTPSFYIDRNNNYKCFGCQGKGDSIAFVMQRDGVDFIRAVKSLIGT